MTIDRPLAAALKKIAVVGAGNIGSQVIPLLAGVPGVAGVILIDPDQYALSNLGRQRSGPQGIGRSKVAVQKQVLRTLAPHITVETYARRIEHLPLGYLRDCTVLVACVDGRGARQHINRIAWRLGIPWIDAALDRAGSVRARVYLPDSACLQCDWDEEEYGLLQQQVPCDPGSAVEAPTAAPMELGAIVAGMAVWLLKRLLAQEPGDADLADRQWLFDVPSGRGWIAHYSGQNPQCRFDHARWTLAPLGRGARDIMLGETFAAAGLDAGNATFAVDGEQIVKRVRCPACRAVRNIGGRLHGRMKAAICKRCSRPMLASALDASDSLSAETVGSGWLDRSLASFGLVDGDVITLGNAATAIHYQIGPANRGTV